MFRCICAGVALLGSVASHAGWQAINLHPLGAAASTANSVSAGKQGGTARFGSTWTAATWSTHPSTFSSLMPVGASFSSVWSSDTSQMAGTYNRGTLYVRAALWSSPAQSFVNLHPSGALSSAVWGVGGGQQVGMVDNHAAAWSGSVASYVDLDPASQYASEAFATNGVHQVGYMFVFGEGHKATIWSGVSGSGVSLHPAGASSSIAYDLQGSTQGGYARIGGVQQAGIWFGTAATFLSLHPSGALASQINAMSGNAQAGYAVFSVRPDDSHIHHAALWKGNSGSFIDLHLVLPPGFESSVAEDVEIDPRGNIWVVGSATRHGSLEPEAMLWHYDPRGSR